jgi:putative transposase
MPRQARVDFPGTLHHIMVRGLNRIKIFKTDKDREAFLERLGIVLEKTNQQCQAFALMPNHAHLLITSGETGISTMMQGLLTRYASYFNRQHRRSGKLFTNRFKSILCDRDDYQLQLVRYIHLNPLRAKLVRDMDGLDRHLWTGHSIYMGRRQGEWLETDEILGMFGRRRKEARVKYRAFVEEGIAEGHRADLSGGGMIRSAGGYWEAVKSMARGEKRELSDERILGGGAFVEAVLHDSQIREVQQSKLERDGWTMARVLDRAAEVVGLAPEDLMVRGRSNARSQGRALACKWMNNELGVSQVRIADYLGISRPSVTNLIGKGRAVALELEVKLDTH